MGSRNWCTDPIGETCPPRTHPPGKRRRDKTGGRHPSGVPHVRKREARETGQSRGKKRRTRAPNSSPPHSRGHPRGRNGECFRERVEYPLFYFDFSRQGFSGHGDDRGGGWKPLVPGQEIASRRENGIERLDRWTKRENKENFTVKGTKSHRGIIFFFWCCVNRCLSARDTFLYHFTPRFIIHDSERWHREAFDTMRYFLNDSTDEHAGGNRYPRK